MKTYVRGGESYAELRRDFKWDLPEYANIGAAASDAHPSGNPAIIHVKQSGERDVYTFGDLSRISNKVANLLRGLGCGVGDTVAVNLGQRPEAAFTHLGVFKARLISVPLSNLFGPEAIRVRLADSKARVLVTTAASYLVLEDVLRDLPDLKHVVVVDAATSHDGRYLSFNEELARASEQFVVEPTPIREACLVLYTSGTTGAPKGVLHGHSVVFAQVPARQMTYDLFPLPGDVVWTPADWAWTGGLVTVLLCTLVHGVPVLCAERTGRLDPEWTLELMANEKVTNGFLPPTVLKMISDLPRRSDLRVRAVSCGGETMYADALNAASEALGGAALCQGYGQTEADAVAGCYPSSWDIVPGSAGRVYPGHDIRAIDADGNEVPTGTDGELALRLPDPSAMLGYFNNPEATEAKLAGGWMRTGDIGRFDDQGYLWFSMRADEMIKSSGYRIGPGEVEDSLGRHPSVESSVVVGVPDPSRGQIVRAYVKIRGGLVGDEELRGQLQAFVKKDLAAYQYPREIEFVDDFKLTSSGKIDRGDVRRRAQNVS